MAKFFWGYSSHQRLMRMALRSPFYPCSDRYRELDHASCFFVDWTGFSHGFAVSLVGLTDVWKILHELPISLGKSSHICIMTYLGGLGYDLGHMEANDFDAVILTGGASRRMGIDKSSLVVDGMRLIERLIQDLLSIDCPVTILGREQETGAEFVADSVEYAGPLASLRNFVPTNNFTFVLSCDIVRFSVETVMKFREVIGGHDAVIPVIDGFEQPLCALYSDHAFQVLRANPQLVRMKDWTALLDARSMSESDLELLGIRPLSIQGANTPEEFHRLVTAEF